MSAEVVPIITRDYMKPGRVYEEHECFSSKSKSYFYRQINLGIVGGCFKIGGRIIINRKKLLEKLENPEQDYFYIEEHWEETCKGLGKRCTLGEIAEILDISYGLVNKIVIENEEELEVEWKRKRKGREERYLNPIKFIKFMKDIDE